ncbi:TrkA-N domain protein [Methanothermus fervidus DSM 2088]|uniref:TrkA-N domain protein n=1 Tax=Methanothermus fervidus (strain ATCC 43054 / DSM 2088 / JCM 10308 / V24 S) TaxID=523846 RepID=E3GX52_METFV|nr:TrkA family potassium uptake protein [Methanothermus fervidus]ADP78047.1 TrkA-N domain protein [Methanothermus fervidus DSM 2088]
MYVVIMGGGRVGSTLADLLTSDGHEVTVIERDKERCKKLESELNIPVICGKGTERNILESAGIENADVFVAATGSDEANLMGCILAKKYNVPKTIARVNNPENEDTFRDVGIDHVISPERSAAGYLEKYITRPKVVDLIVLGRGEAEILELVVKNKEVVGKNVEELSPTKDYIIAAIYSNDEIKIPQPNTKIKENDRLLVLAKSDAIQEVTNLFSG